MRPRLKRSVAEKLVPPIPPNAEEAGDRIFRYDASFFSRVHLRESFAPLRVGDVPCIARDHRNIPVHQLHTVNHIQWLLVRVRVHRVLPRVAIDIQHQHSDACKMNFWNTLPRPFFVQAPMEDVTDAAFRELLARHGKPDVMFTEFTSADGLVLAPERGQRALRKKLFFSEEERPIVAQLFSAYPDRMEQAARIVASLGFDGIDINMGCPDRAAERSGCGAAMIKTPTLAQDIIRAAQRGGGGLPVSVKTRIGYAKNELSTWLPALLETHPAAVTIHARTRNELSEVPARWEHVREAVSIRDACGCKTLIIGNGDIQNIQDARTKAGETHADGVMLGRALYGNPWLFSGRDTSPTKEERLSALAEHLVLFGELLEKTTNYAVMKKHFKAYCSDFDGAKELRVRLMDTSSTTEALALLESHGVAYRA